MHEEISFPLIQRVELGKTRKILDLYSISIKPLTTMLKCYNCIEITSSNTFIMKTYFISTERPVQDEKPSSAFIDQNGSETIKSGTLHGGEEIKPGTLHGGEEIKPGTLHVGE